MSRVTSVELDEEDVKYIENLIAEDRIRSLKEFVEKCVKKFGIAYTLDRWQRGVTNIGPVRVIALMKKALELLVEHVPPEDHENIGREIGEIVSSFIFPTPSGVLSRLGCRLQNSGGHGLGSVSKVLRQNHSSSLSGTSLRSDERLPRSYVKR